MGRFSPISEGITFERVVPQTRCFHRSKGRDVRVCFQNSVANIHGNALTNAKRASLAL